MSLKRFLIYICTHAFVLTAALILFAFTIGPLLDLEYINWDAYWFKEIADSGYSFSSDKMSNVAFFPLLPWLIQLLQFNYDLIQLALVVISVASLWLLGMLSENKTKDSLLFLASPLLFYFIVPYSEALFLFGSVLLLLGLHKRHIPLLIAGAFIAILSRYASMILVPALLLTGLYELLTAKEKVKSTLLLYGSGILSLVAGLALISYIQYLHTGTWNGYQQTHIHWGHYLRWPVLPFYSAMGSSMLLLDQVALLLSVISAVVLTLSLWYKYKGIASLSFTNVQLLSFCYLAGSGASMIAFQGGSLDSLGRYIFATAFIFPLFPVIRNLTYKPLHLIYIFIGSSLFFLLTGSLGSVTHFISNEFVALLLSLLYLLMQLNKAKNLSWNYLLIWITGVSIQAVLFLLYLRGDWVE